METEDFDGAQRLFSVIMSPEAGTGPPVGGLGFVVISVYLDGKVCRLDSSSGGEGQPRQTGLLGGLICN